MELERREELCARVAAGELGLDAPELREFLRQEPEARAELEELARLAAVVNEDAALEREVLALAEEERDAPGADRLQSTLSAWLDERADAEAAPRPSSAIATEERGAPHRPRFGSAPWLAAAALLLVALFAWKPWAPAPSAPPRIDDMLGQGIELLHPDPSAGALAGVEAFRWSGQLPSGGYYMVSVERAGAEPGAAPLLTSGELTEPEWILTPEEASRLHGALVLSIRSLSVTGARLPGSLRTPFEVD